MPCFGNLALARSEGWNPSQTMGVLPCPITRWASSETKSTNTSPGVAPGPASLRVWAKSGSFSASGYQASSPPKWIYGDSGKSPATSSTKAAIFARTAGEPKLMQFEDAEPWIR